MDLLYINLIPTTERLAFEKKVRDVAAALKTEPNWLMQVMKAESGLNPAARNTYAPFVDGYATGLIQFTPSTARSLGTTTQALEKMSRIEQMDYVYKYLKPYTGKLNSYYDTYLVVFFPAAIGKPDNYVFETKSISRASIAKANPAININKDGLITMAEFKQYLKNTVAKSLWSHVFDIGTKPMVAITGILLLIGLGFLIYNG
jgi:hypothetical protein